MMLKKEIENFLLSKNGYLKKSPLEVAKGIWKISPKHSLPKNKDELQRELKQIKDVQATLRMAQSAENSKEENKLIETYHKILEEKNKPKKKLFFDIETSFNIVASWNVGRDIDLSPESIIEERKIITICYKFSDSKKIYSLSWDGNNDDKKMLQQFSKIMDSADIIVGHNGDSFDIKHIRTRCIYHKIPISPKFNSIDSLKMARSGFKFNSNKLNYLGQFLGEGKKLDTGGFQLWKDVVINKSKKALSKMINYCKGDIILLERVYNRLQEYSPEKKFRMKI